MSCAKVVLEAISPPEFWKEMDIVLTTSPVDSASMMPL